MLALLLLLTAARPVLEFPEPGLDNPAAYQGYHTRFYRDARGDAVQVYLDGRSGRVVLLWADAADQSAAFTARDTAGAPVVLAWGSPGADVSAAEGHRAVAYRLRLPARPVAVGQFALGSMRWERDIQYQHRHLAPIDSTLPPVPEFAGAEAAPLTRSIVGRSRCRMCRAKNSPARRRTTSSRNISRAAPTYFRRRRRCGSPRT